MIEWVLIILLLLLGLALLILELIFIPGTTVVGLLGLLLNGLGIYFAYDYFGSMTGNIVLSISLLVNAITLYYSFNSGVWERFALKNVSEGKSKTKFLSEFIVAGDRGTSLSALRPAGKARFADQDCEVWSLGEYIDPERPLLVVRVEGDKVFVREAGEDE